MGEGIEPPTFRLTAGRCTNSTTPQKLIRIAPLVKKNPGTFGPRGSVAREEDSRYSTARPPDPIESGFQLEFRFRNISIDVLLMYVGRRPAVKEYLVSPRGQPDSALRERRCVTRTVLILRCKQPGCSSPVLLADDDQVPKEQMPAKRALRCEESNHQHFYTSEEIEQARKKQA